MMRSLSSVASASKAAVAFSAALLAVIAWPAPSRAAEVVEWRNVPLSIVLTVGEERVLAFPDNVQVGVPAALTPELFRTQSTGGTVLWLARRPFETQRVQVRLMSSGRVMLFDVTAVDSRGHASGSAEPIQVIFPEAVSGTGNAGDAAAPTPIALTRYAAQQLYAPLRVLRDVPEIRRVPMGTAPSVELYRGADLRAEPLGSWQGGGLYITAVRLTNLGSARVVLDPRRLRGRFVAATFQHNTLGPANTRSDTTCVYLVTDRPFTASIVPSSGVAVAGGEGGLRHGRGV
jgi:integrating conjugative element protein (TIGR03749 family)